MTLFNVDKLIRLQQEVKAVNFRRSTAQHHTMKVQEDFICNYIWADTLQKPVNTLQLLIWSLNSLAIECARTSQVSVKVVHPLYFSLQLIPHGFLQSFPLCRTFHQSLIRLRYPLNLQLQLGRKCKKMIGLWERHC